MTHTRSTLSEPVALLASSMAGIGLVCFGSFIGLVVTASVTWPSAVVLSSVFSVATIASGYATFKSARALTTHPYLACGLAVALLAALERGVGPIAGPVTPPITLGWLAGTAAGVGIGSFRRGPSPRFGLIVSQGPSRLRMAAAVAGALASFVMGIGPAHAWIASVRRKTPTPAMLRTNGIDMQIDTHQWLANQAVVILRNDAKTSIATFLDTEDPTAPLRTAASGARPGTHESYRWQLVRGSADADGSLYPLISDHFLNWWTHGGRQWIAGASAASNAETAFDNAVIAWNTGRRGTAMHWLGAAVHLMTDACVPQHEFFSVNVYHHQYEEWVRRNQKALSVARSGIYRDSFRVKNGHGGPDWSSAHPRGWADECAHRAAANLQGATHANARTLSRSDPQWITAPHIADTQRLSAGLISLFFDQVGTP